MVNLKNSQNQNEKGETEFIISDFFNENFDQELQSQNKSLMLMDLENLLYYSPETIFCVLSENKFTIKSKDSNIESATASRIYSLGVIILELLDFFPSNFSKYFFGFMKLNKNRHEIFEEEIKSFISKEKDNISIKIQEIVQKCLIFDIEKRINLIDLENLGQVIKSELMFPFSENKSNIKDSVNENPDLKNALNRHTQEVSNLYNQEENKKNIFEGYHLLLFPYDISDKFKNVLDFLNLFFFEFFRK